MQGCVIEPQLRDSGRSKEPGRARDDKADRPRRGVQVIRPVAIIVVNKLQLGSEA